MIYIKIFILSLIQSFTEYLPISSSAHLILFSKILNQDKNIFNMVFIVSQFATTVVVIFFYKKEIFDILFYFLKRDKYKNIIYKLFISFFPLVIFGFLFYSLIKKYLQNNIYIISISLIIGGFCFIFIENKIINKKIKFHFLNDIDILSALKIGLCQIFSLIPGISRSGSTIISSLFFGLDRKLAVDYSFLLSIPVSLAALFYEIYKNYNLFSYSAINNWKLLIFSFFITLFFSFLVIKVFINYISKKSFKIFAYYRIILGIILLIFR